MEVCSRALTVLELHTDFPTYSWMCKSIVVVGVYKLKKLQLQNLLLKHHFINSTIFIYFVAVVAIFVSSPNVISVDYDYDYNKDVSEARAGTISRHIELFLYLCFNFL